MADAYDAEDLGLLARQVVLPHRDESYVSRLLEKLLSQDVVSALDLIKVSSSMLEKKLDSSSDFNIGEMADVSRMRAVVEKNQAPRPAVGGSRPEVLAAPAKKSGLSGGRLSDLKSLDTYIDNGGRGGHRGRSPRRRSRNGELRRWNSNRGKGGKGNGTGNRHSSYENCGHRSAEGRKPALWAAIEAKDLASVE